MSEKPCPFCGSHVLYEGYHDIDGFTTPVMFCNGCKATFFVEGSEDWVSDRSDGMEELRIAWNRRIKPAYATVKLPKETQERFKKMIHDEVAKAALTLKAENAKLRELVRDMCVWAYIDSYCDLQEQFAARMRELGIEVK